MAGDWIKMRSDIYRDPKVSVIAESLMEEGGLLATYVNQIFQRDIAVTRNVMRNAVVGALVSVWGVMRQRGKRSGDDLVCDGVTVNVLDDVADLPGFGEAMELAGWVEATDAGIAFRRFFEEHNVDPTDRAKTSNAERQKRYRERLKSSHSGDATRNATVTPREEKSREEINTPQPPKGEVGVACDYEAIIKAYADMLPSLPQPRLMDDKRKKAMRKRWDWVLTSIKSDGTRRATNAEEAAEWFRAYFGRASKNAWLMGENPGKGHEGWKADLDFLMTDRGIKAVLERTEVTA